MNYKSTRSLNEEYVSAANAIKNGLAPDGGLYMPESIPSLSQDEIISLSEKSYAERAAYIMSKFLTEYSHDELLSDCNQAYSEKKFPGGAAPIHKIDDKVYSLELWHGPTCAFKDMALQIMPRLLSRALEKTDEKRTALILVATSGDTGKAALEGYRDVDRIKIKVFYPVNGVSRVQKLQMATQEGNNVDVCAIHGNFDDAQNGVKAIFADTEFAKELNEKDTFLSSANSINWGRLVPQVVYYVSAYCDMLKNGEIKLGDKLDVCVPTGNFGNIFAAYIAKLMGLPLGKLVCASNMNNILTDFLENGTYDRNRSFFTTISPSMDILISSNLERLLYFCAGSDKTREYMKELNENGEYQVDADILAKIRDNFCGYFADESATAATLRKFYDNYGYLCDTHTAVGFNCAEQYIEETGDALPIITASTASPYKFAGSVYQALTDCKAADGYAALEELSTLTGVAIPAPLAGLDSRKIRFERVCDPEDMLNDVFENL
jgi:threonine synthase